MPVPGVRVIGLELLARRLTPNRKGMTMPFELIEATTPKPTEVFPLLLDDGTIGFTDEPAGICLAGHADGRSCSKRAFHPGRHRDLDDEDEWSGCTCDEEVRCCHDDPDLASAFDMAVDYWR